jgi:phospholipid transport system substrate-binding protein
MAADCISRRQLLAGSAAGAAVFSAGPRCGLAAAAESEKIVQTAANEFLNVVKDGGKRAAFAQLLERYVAVNDIALFALGKYRRKLSPAMRASYTRLAHSFFLNALTTHGSKVRGRAFVVTGSYKDIVSGYIQHGNDRRTRLDWRIRAGRITDLKVQGIWLALALREDFNRIIDRAGGDIGAIFTYLKTGERPS